MLSDLVLESEPLNRVLDGKEITKADAYEIFGAAINNAGELYRTSTVLRNRHKGKTVTFSKKAFFNLVNLCKDTCGYCTYKSEPGESKLSLMSKSNYMEIGRASCRERV